MGLRTLSIDPNHRASVQLMGRLTCLCPVNGQRDYATVEVTYIPTASVFELGSFAAYLGGYATMTIGHEDLTETLASALYDAVEPDELTVRTHWEAVEGVQCTVASRR